SAPCPYPPLFRSDQRQVGHDPSPPAAVERFDHGACAGGFFAFSTKPEPSSSSSAQCRRSLGSLASPANWQWAMSFNPSSNHGWTSSPRIGSPGWFSPNLSGSLVTRARAVSRNPRPLVISSRPSGTSTSGTSTPPSSPRHHPQLL